MWKDPEAKTAYFREYAKERNAWLKAHHMCKECKQQDAYTLAGRSRCYDCARKAREDARRRYDPEKRKQTLKREREQAAAWRAQGKCSRCGRALNGGFKTCARCREKNARYQRERNDTYMYPRGANGICTSCNKEYRLPGKGLCAACYARQVGILERVREQRLGTGEQMKIEG